MVMEQIPVIASLDELPRAIEHAERVTTSRWYVMRRAMVLGGENQIPEPWLDSLVAAYRGTAIDRGGMAASGQALPDGSFPIPNRTYLERAVKAFEKSKSHVIARKHIISRARALDAVDLLPADWGASVTGQTVTAGGAVRSEPESTAMTANETVGSLRHALLDFSSDQTDLEGLTASITDITFAADAFGHLDEFISSGTSLVASLANVDRLTEDEHYEVLEAMTAAIRKVRTAAGADFFDQPIGSVIVPNVYLPMGTKSVKDLERDYVQPGAKGADKRKVHSKPDVDTSDDRIVTVELIDDEGEITTQKMASNSRWSVYKAVPKGTKATLAADSKATLTDTNADSTHDPSPSEMTDEELKSNLEAIQEEDDPDMEMQQALVDEIDKRSGLVTKTDAETQAVAEADIAADDKVKAAKGGYAGKDDGWRTTSGSWHQDRADADKAQARIDAKQAAAESENPELAANKDLSFRAKDYHGRPSWMVVGSSSRSPNGSMLEIVKEAPPPSSGSREARTGIKPIKGWYVQTSAGYELDGPYDSPDLAIEAAKNYTSPTPRTPGIGPDGEFQADKPKAKTSLAEKNRIQAAARAKLDAGGFKYSSSYNQYKAPDGTTVQILAGGKVGVYPPGKSMWSTNQDGVQQFDSLAGAVDSLSADTLAGKRQPALPTDLVTRSLSKKTNVKDLLDAKQALHRLRDRWHADPSSMSKGEFMAAEKAAQKRVADEQAKYDAGKVTPPAAAAKPSAFDGGPSDPSIARAPSPKTGAFVSDGTRSLGTINPDAKGKDPDRFNPKVTYADGNTPRAGERVRDKNGRVGTAAELYQAYTAVRWDDTGRVQTLKNDRLNASGGATGATTVEPREAAGKATEATVKVDDSTAKTDTGGAGKVDKSGASDPFISYDRARGEAEAAEAHMNTFKVAGDERRAAWREWRDRVKEQIAAQAAIEALGQGHVLPDKGPTIRVKNKAQKILLQEELLGQISDGMWENSGPRDHWRDWTSAEIIVDSRNPGRNFRVQKDNYQLNGKNLLEIVGDRMVESVQKAGDPGYDDRQMRKDLADLRTIFKTPRKNHEGGIMDDPGETVPVKPGAQVSTVKSGRGPGGRVRNFETMGDAKFVTEAAKVEAENIDPEALAAVAASRKRRSAGKSPAELILAGVYGKELRDALRRDNPSWTNAQIHTVANRVAKAAGLTASGAEPTTLEIMRVNVAIKTQAVKIGL